MYNLNNNKEKIDGIINEIYKNKENFESYKDIALGEHCSYQGYPEFLEELGKSGKNNIKEPIYSAEYLNNLIKIGEKYGNSFYFKEEYGLIGNSFGLYKIGILMKLSKFLNLNNLEIFYKNFFEDNEIFNIYATIFFNVNDYLNEQDEGELFNENILSDISKYQDVYFVYIDGNNFDIFFRNDFIKFIGNNDCNFIKISLGSSLNFFPDNFNTSTVVDYNTKVIDNIFFNNDYKNITVKKKEGKISYLEGDIELIGDDIKFVDLKNKYPHSKIEADSYYGKINKYKIKEKIKLENKNKSL